MLLSYVFQRVLDLETAENVEKIVVKGSKKWEAYLEALVVALSRENVREIIVEGAGKAIEKILKIVDILEFNTPIIFEELSKEVLEKPGIKVETSKGSFEVPVYALKLVKGKNFNRFVGEKNCAEDYKRIRFKSQKRFHRYVTAIAFEERNLAVAGLCLEASGRAIKTLFETVDFIRRRLPQIYGAFKLVDVGFASKKYLRNGKSEVVGVVNLIFSRATTQI